MRLAELLHRLPEVTLDGDPTTVVTGVTHDTRKVAPGDLFAALPGAHTHGVEHLPEALARGARAVLCDRPRPPSVSLPWLVSSSPRRAMALAAWAVSGDPQDHLTLIGVTGTNGKSTTVDLVRRILGAAGHAAAALGTLGVVAPDGSRRAGARTTPEATDLAATLRQLVEGGCTAAALEVSSHAIALDRVAGLPFAVAVWTNLSQDHLDFHPTMEDYFATKLRLLTELTAVNGCRVAPADASPWSTRLAAVLGPSDLTWGVERGDIRASSVRADLDGTRFTLVLPSAEHQVHLPLVGPHNLANALAAAAAAVALGLDGEAIVSGLESARPISGRLESIATPLPCPVYVDYAHTPAALEAVVSALRAVTDRRLIVVFGAGGDRDRGKRGPMGEAVGRFADLAVVTSDNPRSEDPAAIADAVAAGVRATGAEPLVILDRREAIAEALSLADERSLVLVAGKGHETTQTVGGTVRPFADHEVIAELAAALRGGPRCR